MKTKIVNRTGCGIPKKRCDGKFWFDLDNWRLTLNDQCKKCYLMLRKPNK